MLDPVRRAEIDQELANLAEILPPAWWALYQGCQKTGFSKVQAYQLVMAYVIGTAAGRVVPPSDAPSDEKEDI